MTSSSEINSDTLTKAEKLLTEEARKGHLTSKALQTALKNYNRRLGNIVPTNKQEFNENLLDLRGVTTGIRVMLENELVRPEFIEELLQQSEAQKN